MTTPAELAQPPSETCDSCGAEPNEWCRPGCDEQPDPALRLLDREELRLQVAALTAERDRLVVELEKRKDFSVEGLAHALRLRLKFATPEERLTAIGVVCNGFCNGCACDVPPRCHCENDE